ncbi:MAG: hypothetical protein KatS3mg124_1747 [Porticoccaceae bacterium]|nr:MAG: hypothetical protein KatS3mg124_1747 [Porticoccaceae bacterium]
MEKPPPPGVPISMVSNTTLGAKACRLVVSRVKAWSISSPLMADTATGTSWMVSARLRAVTTISSSWLAAKAGAVTAAAVSAAQSLLRFRFIAMSPPGTLRFSGLWQGQPPAAAAFQYKHIRLFFSNRSAGHRRHAFSAPFQHWAVGCAGRSRSEGDHRPADHPSSVASLPLGCSPPRRRRRIAWWPNSLPTGECRWRPCRCRPKSACSRPPGRPEAKCSWPIAGPGIPGGASCAWRWRIPRGDWVSPFSPPRCRPVRETTACAFSPFPTIAGCCSGTSCWSATRPLRAVRPPIFCPSTIRKRRALPGSCIAGPRWWWHRMGSTSPGPPSPRLRPAPWSTWRACSGRRAVTAPRRRGS